MLLLKPEELTLIGALAGTIIGATTGAVIAYINKRSEERKHHKEIVVKTALEHWKQVAEHLKTNNRPFLMPPFQTYIIHMSVFADLVFDEKITPQNVGQKLKQIESLMDAVNKQTAIRGNTDT